MKEDKIWAAGMCSNSKKYMASQSQKQVCKDKLHEEMSQKSSFKQIIENTSCPTFV